MNDFCPWCSFKAVDITSNDDFAGFDQRRRFICIGPECHEWREGDGPDSEQQPLIILASH